MFEITYDKPLPPRKGRGRTAKYPFSQMKVGASFFARGAKPETLIRAAASWRKREGQPEVRFVAEAEAEGARIYRVL